MDIKDYITTLRRRWRLIVTVLLICLAASAFLTWQQTPKYASSARLFVATSESDSQDAYQGGLFATQRVASYADIVPKSRKLANQVVDDLGGNGDPVKIAKQVSAKVVPNTVNLQITAVDPDPVRARDIAQAYAEELSKLVAELETPEGQAAPLIKAEIVDNAVVPADPVSPQPARNLALGAVLGLLLGMGVALLREFLDNSISTTDDFGRISSAPILGHVTADSSAVKLAPGSALSSNSHWAESFRVLRTNMQFLEIDSDQKVIVVTSSLPGEGKTTMAVNLALTMALTNQRVALVECDLRRPLIAKRLGIDGAVGTTSVLIGKISVHEAMQSVGEAGLQVLACGPIPPNPAELLESKAMESLLEQLKSEFDVVILDAPPLLPVTDAALLSAQADGAIVVVRHGKTTRDQLLHAVQRLDAVDAKTLGAVFNMVPTRRGGVTYAYSYSYSYDYSSPKPVEKTGDHAKPKLRQRIGSSSSSSKD